METEILFKSESYRIIGACFEVYNEQGTGFLESVYQECLAIEMKSRSIPCEEKVPLKISYKGTLLTQRYIPDFLCFDEILVEIKATKTLTDDHRAQVINYLKATGKKLGLLINFGNPGKLEHERLICR